MGVFVSDKKLLKLLEYVNRKIIALETKLDKLHPDCQLYIRYYNEAKAFKACRTRINTLLKGK